MPADAAAIAHTAGIAATRHVCAAQNAPTNTIRKLGSTLCRRAIWRYAEKSAARRRGSTGATVKLSADSAGSAGCSWAQQATLCLPAAPHAGPADLSEHDELGQPTAAQRVWTVTLAGNNLLDTHRCDQLRTWHVSTSRSVQSMGAAACTGRSRCIEAVGYLLPAEISHACSISALG